MDAVKFTMSRQEADLAIQALDVYATTLMCAPLGLGMDLLVSVRDLRARLEETVAQDDVVRDAAGAQDGNVLRFARG
ncbi:hypothetical protein [Methylopila sp. 73B]|uniref:hypothetical protein n=1 Tax=Methylopila sp. 73B TaxID=1120792 RepID=UPI00036C93B5|nr:hypothetical protein [Methylopila sp. 73B]